MNDPHVVALHYNIDHDPSIAFDKAKPLDHRETAFDVRVEDKKARFTFKEHHATAKAARAAVEEFIRAWEFEAALQRGANAFTLRYHHADIEDRNPTPGVVTVSPMPATFSFRTGKASGVVSPPSYPSPPSMPLKVSPRRPEHARPLPAVSRWPGDIDKHGLLLPDRPRSLDPKKQGGTPSRSRAARHR